MKEQLKNITPQQAGCSLWQLFWSFLKIGLFTFGGGYAMIPLIKRQVVERTGWIEEKYFLELLTLAQSAPGPISLNAAVFVGYRMRGYKGALSAVAGVVLPSFVIILVIAIYFTRINQNRYASAALKGMTPAVVALILAPIYGLTKGMGWKRLLIAVVAAFGVWYWAVSPIWFIIAGIVGGVLWVYIRDRKEAGR